MTALPYGVWDFNQNMGWGMIFSYMKGGVTTAVGYKPICSFRFAPEAPSIFGDILPISSWNVEIIDLSHSCLKSDFSYILENCTRSNYFQSSHPQKLSNAVTVFKNINENMRRLFLWIKTGDWLYCFSFGHSAAFHKHLCILERS